MLAIVAPGQGAQKSGFLAPWLADPTLADRAAELAEAAQVDLAELGTTADDDTIRDTAVAQPLLVAAATLTAPAILPADLSGIVIAGHSVGELAAAAIAGVITDTEAMALVSVRGRAMAAAAATTPTSMAALIGGDPEVVLAAIERAGLNAANHNGKGQIVAAGTVEQLDAFTPPARVRKISLSVAGAFHTEHMRPAVDALAEARADIAGQDPTTALLTNADGSVVASGAAYLDRIVAQVASPVRWDRCMDTFATLGVTGLLELPPAGTLTGIAKRNLAGVEVFALNTPDELAEARDFVAEHTSTDAHTSTGAGN
ncbi:ACP S-malonyltransferase [Parenemella sanctibonifatiensis]|uniref:[acyl-carrier-protein] S-malonyltransferase n=1 Tax=Parenemella sanctibonifatiensis TaxID=2016505 RepID=A0A255EB36_9ACTN|nr:ACP S-malonyltransferase [Parenemella sanctibonifatiensis]OYN85353.1 ACP S-malonyltransferase [Parenemella sanctibonifatiensis]